MDFSVTEASTAGFRVMGRRPISTLVWVLVWTVLGIGAIGLLFLWSWPQLSETAKAFQSADTDPRALAATMVRFELSVFQALWPGTLWLILLSVVLQAAIFRAVIEPGRSAFAYLRVGGDELRLLLLTVIYFVLSMVYFSALGLACALLIAAEQQLVQPWAGLLVFVTVASAICLTFHIAVRLVLASPMTFANKRLQVFDSWRVTRGRFWPIVGVFVLAMVFVIGIGIAIGVIRNALIAGVMSGFIQDMIQHPNEPQRIFARLAAFVNSQNFGPTLAGVVVLQGIGSMLSRVILAGALAETYRVLSTPPSPEPREGSVYVPITPAPPAGGLQADEHAHADPHAAADGSAHSESHSDGG